MASSLATDASDALPSSAVPTQTQSTASFLASTPKRGRGRAQPMREACLTSTPDCNSSTDNLSPIETKQMELERTTLISQLETSVVHSPCSRPKAQSRPRMRHAVETAKPRRGRKRKKEQTQTCIKNSSPPGKCRRRKGQKMEEGEATAQPPRHCRPRFELEEPNATAQDWANEDETSLSSDLSIELSSHEEQLASFTLQEEEEEEEDEEELPSFLMQMDKKPLSITQGVFVWCKFRNHPFWPAMVKSVNRKLKKASIVFIDGPLIDKQWRGLRVALKTLKPYDCEEANQFVCKAKEKYDAAIEWSLELITDYRIRIACGSFTGSLIEYLAHDMSYPVRRKYPLNVSERLTITSTMEECDDEVEEESFSEQHEVSRISKRLLPDRTHAAHNRANERLVHFIVKQRMVESRLLAVISGQQQSKWLCPFLSGNRRLVVNIYLEDDKQLDEVYRYLNELYEAAPATASCLADMKFMDRVRFVLDVLLPEAIIYAIAGVENVPVKKAEEKYLNGRCISNRERQHFDWMIDQQMRRNSMRQNTAHPHSTAL